MRYFCSSAQLIEHTSKNKRKMLNKQTRVLYVNSKNKLFTTCHVLKKSTTTTTTMCKTQHSKMYSTQPYHAMYKPAPLVLFEKVRTLYNEKKDQQTESDNKDEKKPTGFFDFLNQEAKKRKKEGDEKQEQQSSGDGNNSSSNMLAYIVGIGAAFWIMATLEQKASEMNYRNNKEITFQTFLLTYLNSATLDHLEFNRHDNEVYVYLKKDGSSSGIASGELQGDVANRNGQEASGDVLQAYRDSKTRREAASANPMGYDFYFKVISVEDFETKLLEAEERYKISPSHSTPVMYRENFNFRDVGVSLLETVGIIALLLYLNGRRGGRGSSSMMDIFSVSKVGAKSDHKVNVSFKDVAGMEEAKFEISEFVSLLSNPEHYVKLGAKIPRGAILMGPPGTGKTLLAKAVAGESQVPFFSIAGSDFVEMFVGVGAARVRDLFARARQHKSAIIYIDEIDAIARPRGLNSMYGGGNDERESTLNQLLVEMDGFTENQNIIILASTNVDKDGLDNALLRPGRFDRQITIDRPDQKDRELIFQVHLKKLQLADDVLQNIVKLADLTPGFTGADIANVCNESGIYAARDNKDKVTLEHMEKAIERVVGGLEKKNAPILPDEKRVIAFHEAGHAIVSWFCKNCDPLLKISIIPRGKALGYAQYLPQEKFIRTYEELLDIIAQAIGGRAAEKVVFNHLSTGAKDDLQKITRIAYAAVSTFGMNAKVGPLSFPIPGDPSISIQKPYSQHTAQAMDEEVRQIVQSAFLRAEQILKDKEKLLHQVADYLMVHEVMSMEKFREFAGVRPFDAPMSSKKK